MGCAADGAGVENIVVFIVGTAGYPFCQRLFAFNRNGGKQIPNRADLFDTGDKKTELADQAVEERAVLLFFAARGRKRIVQADNMFEQATRGNGRIGNCGFQSFGDFAVFPQPSRFVVFPPCRFQTTPDLKTALPPNGTAIHADCRARMWQLRRQGWQVRLYR